MNLPLRASVAESLGYRWYRLQKFPSVIGMAKNQEKWTEPTSRPSELSGGIFAGGMFAGVPRFDESLDAMGEAIQALTPKERERWSTELCKIVGAHRLFETANATAEQRATAFLRVKGKTL